ncbi:hypothetical protein M9Y10_020642 [Tritrichomonas musculus]|uniref:Protein kinase domain-containing protein n=1 Tax=Tritrichomonas musculus TaxID=1915356 RepID=A0ABR2HFD3_9EUKA
MNSSIELRNFAILERIGKGSFGEVYKIKNKKTGDVCAAKISLNVVDEESTEIIRDISREVNILSKINNISILKFIGFSSVNFQNEPKPVIVTEYLANGSLNDILNLERKSLADFDWNSTRKLITIYGIASAMAYLHSNNIIHRDLKPANILMDDFLCPKIADFGLSKMKHSNSETMSIESTLAIKGTPIYISPEIWKNMEYTKASDVYSFGIIIYEIITNEEPFKEFDVFEIRSKVKKGFRPPFNCPIPESYKNLIERCWSQDPEERPTFDQILNDLKTDSGFITDLIEEIDYMDYMEYVDNYASTFDPKKKIIQIDQFIKRETVTFHKITIPKKSKDSKKILVKETIPETKQQTLKEQKTKRFSGFLKKSKSKEKSIYPSNELILLDKKCQILVQEANKDAEKQFQVGQNLIEGKNDFPNNTEIGIKYLEKSTKGGCIDAVSYYCKMLIKGNVIPKDHPKAKKILKKYLKGKNGTILFLYGKIKKKEGDMMKAMKYLDKASKLGNGQAMYEIGKIFFKGINCQKDEKKAQQYFEMAKNNGFDKSESFFAKLDKDYLFDYGLKLYQGKGVPVDKKAAAKYLQMAIEKDSYDAMFLYGQMLENGDGISPDPSKAIEYYKIAADKGNVESMYNYALMLYNGNGVPDNKKEASVYFKKAADQDDQKAIIKYSKMMYDGDGVPVNKKEASIYYKKAADKDDLDSIIKYSKMLYEGDGVPVNKKEASVYYKKAADKGDLDSIIKYGKMMHDGDGVLVIKKKQANILKKQQTMEMQIP